MAITSRKRRAEDLSDTETQSQSSNARAGIRRSTKAPKPKASLPRRRVDSKELDASFETKKASKSLPKREHPQRKRRKTEKAVEPTDDEVSDASFTLLTDNERDDGGVLQEVDSDSSESGSVFGNVLESSVGDFESPETAVTNYSPVQVDKINHLSASVDGHKDEVDVCVSPEDYGLSVYIYKCLKRSDPIAFNLSQWEQRHGICTMVSDEDELDMHVIPVDAQYLIFGDYMIGELGGSVIFWAAKVNENQPDEKYVLKVGFYYEYRDCLKAWVDEVRSPNCCVPLVELEEILSLRDGLRFRALYTDMEWAINLEYWSRNQRPQLKKFVPYIHNEGTRRRSRVITILDIVFDDEDEDAGSETDSNATVLAPVDTHLG